jgi:lipooligosaccharide transport system permease protein
MARVVSPVHASLIVVEGMWTWYRRNWRATVVSSVVQPVLFLLALGFGLGSQVRPTEATGGLTYVVYLAPALLVATSVQIAAFESTYPILSAFKWQQTYLGIAASPITPGQIFGGHLMWVALRLGASGAAYLVVAAFLGALTSFGVLASLLVAVLAGLAVPVRRHADDPVRRHVLPGVATAGMASATCLGDTAVARHRAQPRRRVGRPLPARRGRTPRVPRGDDWRGCVVRRPDVHEEAGRVTSGVLLRALPTGMYAGRARVLVERSLLVNRRAWLAVVSGFCEPLFYLFAMGVGFGTLVGDVIGPDGTRVSFVAFVAPALLAASAMNGAVYDATFNIFFKFKYAKLYDAMLATPLGPIDVALGEIAWALLRGGLYAVGFLTVMLTMGLLTSWWAVLALPAAVLVAFSFAAIGMACTTFMRSWQDFDLIQLALLPMFLFSTTFFPLTVYPEPIRVVVRCLPLYHAIELMRKLCAGVVEVGMLGHLAYFAVMAGTGVVVSARRLGVLLLR